VRTIAGGDLPRIHLLRTWVNRGLERVGRPLAPGARIVYSRARVKNPSWVGERKDKSKVTQYSNQELQDILKEQGREPTELRKQADEAARAQAPTLREGDLPRGPEPTQIMDEASAQGITVPREQIGAFLFCVVREMRSTSLPEAVGDCAKDLPGE
jgi:hypothetical protein